ncbi:inactive protein RESTRICTED TEV MOVEMENT 2-like isoform X2 [Vicia villosa]|uniref:inactive protein RESTRICTED TEV MOVEMENT 2-like isoform X2 n=1 Tax=Vicia villosa TaxID=3911 RepID=UPI00273B7FE3|nr:inactive protein RESTRICTED TEV MOVEMENT 2-like isoform X2 [Vicia villosa]
MALNSQRTFRAQSLRYPLSNRRVYETVEPSSEIKETAEAYFLHVKLPGYTIIRPKIALEDASKKLRITGERPIADDKWEKFDQTYPVPENSDAEKLEAKFEQEILILKMQKKPISPSQVVAPKNQPDPLSNEDLDETKVEKVQETMKTDSPQTQSIEKNTQEATHDDTLSQIAKEAISNNEPQRGLQELEQKPTFIERTKTQIDEKGQEAFEKKPTLLQRIITQIYEKAQKSREELEEKATSIERTTTQLDVKAQKGQEEFIERTKTQIDEKDHKGQAEFETKPTVTERTKTQIDEKVKKGQEESIEKSQTETNEKPQKVQEEFEPKPIEKLEEKIIRNSVKKERMLEKEESEDKKEKPYYESIKAMIDVKNQNLKENEIEKEKLPAPKVTENENESCSIITPKQEEKNGVEKLAITSSQLVTRMADGKWRSNERNLVKNVGVAVLVIAAFGAYISYRFSS